MEKITVSKIVNTKPDKYGTSVRVKTNEHGQNRIYMISVKDASLIKEGGAYEGEGALWKKTDEGTDKETEWWSFKLPGGPARNGGGGMSDNDRAMIKRAGDE